MRTDHLFDRYYFSNPAFVDGTTEFHRLLADQIKPGSSILEVGSGPENATTKYLATLGRVTGVDVSSEIDGNRALSDKYVFDGKRFPFADSRFDACVADWVNEHLDEPRHHFSEVARVLRPRGVYCFRTPNRWHYFTLGSQLMPFGMHVRLAKKLRALPEGAHDPYPTFYRANTFSRVGRLCRQSGLLPVRLFAIEKEPSYGRLHAALFYPMLLYERLVNSCPHLACFRASILAVLRKPGTYGDEQRSASLQA